MAVLQARILEWIATPSSRGSSQPRDQACISCLLHWWADCWSLAPPGKAWDSTEASEELPSLTLSSPCLLYPCPAWGLSLNGALDSTESDIFPSHYLKRNFNPTCCTNNKTNSLTERSPSFRYVCNIIWASLAAQMVKNPPVMQQIWVWPLGWEDSLEEGDPTPVFLPGESHGQRLLVGYSLWGHKELDMAEWWSKAQPHIHTYVRN